MQLHPAASDSSDLLNLGAHPPLLYLHCSRRVPARLPPALPAPGRARTPACEEKAWIRRVGENKEPVEDAGPIVWALGEPRPARTLAPCSGFLLLFSPAPAFLPLLLPASVPRRRKASLSVFTADLDLNVHTIKARGECQEWGWLSTGSRRGTRQRCARGPERGAGGRGCLRRTDSGRGTGGGRRRCAPQSRTSASAQMRAGSAWLGARFGAALSRGAWGGGRGYH
ncbi:uncharacterized protein LOC130023441 [Sorex fumeus]|uniref:uncharacterized protein LOC130023441 n=1 Tax=Sorex fumeus TaxID=62283 RepID=UPI0024AD573E|nr:uncharacterized protein LOC130023441 [Sorex fumeus]